MGAKLVVQAPGAEPQDLPLEKAVITLGRDSECDVVLDFDYVSRRHARVEQAGSDYALIDMDSTNGTFLNGQRVEGRQALMAGDRIEIGDLSITFLAPSSAGETKFFQPSAGDCPIRCDSSSGKVLVRDRPVDAHFFPEEFQLLSILASRYGKVCLREDLGTAIWGRGNFDYGKLAEVVRRVKDKLGPREAGLIESVPGRGYKIAEPGAGAAPVPASSSDEPEPE